MLINAIKGIVGLSQNAKTVLVGVGSAIAGMGSLRLFQRYKVRIENVEAKKEEPAQKAPKKSSLPG